MEPMEVLILFHHISPEKIFCEGNNVCFVIGQFGGEMGLDQKNSRGYGRV